jgi:hypothetical protein
VNQVEHPRPARGRIEWYAVAFALMIASAVVLVITSLGSLSSLRLLWVSAGLSVLAIALSLVSVVVPRR